MKTKFLLLFGLSSFGILSAQFSTPNTGSTWTLNDIYQASPTTISIDGDNFILHQDLLIEETDSLIITDNLTLKIDAGVEIDVKGFFKMEPSENLGIQVTSTDLANPYKGFWFYDTSEIIIKNTRIEHGGGLRVITPNFIMDHCVVSNNHNTTGSSTGGAITFSNGNPIITNSTFENNIHPAIGSAANAQVYALIQNNVFSNNNLTNNNRPQINMGPSGTNGILRILDNEIIGNPDHHMVGGIAVSSLTGIPTQTEIKNNVVRDNRYGITAIGPVGGEISDNILENNDAEITPNNGGSGISLYNTQNFKIRNNQIRQNLWGITVIGTAQADLGTEEDPGNNVFSQNGNNDQIFALYNNTANQISALQNCWIEGEESTADDVENVITHLVDDASLGEVLFDPFLCGEVDMDVIDLDSAKFIIYPNPSNNAFFVESKDSGWIKILDLNGKLILTQNLHAGKNQFNTQLSKGIYLIEFNSNQKKSTQKLIIK